MAKETAAKSDKVSWGSLMTPAENRALEAARLTASTKVKRVIGKSEFVNATLAYAVAHPAEIAKFVGVEIAPVEETGGEAEAA